MKKVSIVLLTIIAVITHWRWFFNFEILTYGDWGFYYNETQRELFSLPNIWTSNGIGSVALTAISMWPINLLWGLFAKFTNYAISERILYLFPSIFFPLICCYLLIKKILKSNTAAIVGAIIFAFNTYMLVGRTAHLTLMVAFGICPLVIRFFIETLENGTTKSAVKTGLAFFLVGVFEFRVLYICIWVCVLYFTYCHILQKNWRWKFFFKNISLIVLEIFIITILNLYWLLSFIEIFRESNIELFNRSLFGNAYMSIAKSISLFHPFWSGGAMTPFEVQPIPYYFFLIPIFAFTGMYFNRKNAYIVFFGIISMIGILLSKQVAPPFTEMYPWLYVNFPGFSLFREASKFYFLIALGYSILIASLVNWVLTSKIYHRVFKYFLVFFVVWIFIVNTKPLFTGEIGTLFVPKQIPSDYIIIKNFILRQPEFFRTLWLPTDSRWSINTISHPKVSGINDLFKFYDPINAPQVDKLLSLVNGKYSDNLIDLHSVKYIALPMNDVANQDDLFKIYGIRRINYLNSLNDSPYLNKIVSGTKELVIYENKNFRPHIYLTDSIETYKKQLKYFPVNHTYRSTSEYKLTLFKVSKPFFINFSEAYNEGWKLRIGSFSWLNTLLDHDYSIGDEFKLKNDAGLNSFKINPEYLCNIYQCKAHSDGSYDIYLTLYFKPQGFVYLGLFITLIVLVVFIVLVFYIKKKHLNV